MRTAPFIDDLVVRAEDLERFLPKLQALLAEYPDLLYTLQGHVGDGNLHVIPLIKMKDVPAAKKTIEELSKKVYQLVLDFHGSITAEHNDGIIRTPFLKQMYGERVTALFEETKRVFDPDGIFNPGKKTGGTMEYMLNHIISS